MSRLRVLQSLWREESGQDLIEYALVAALLALASITSLKGLEVKITTVFNNIGNNL